MSPVCLICLDPTRIEEGDLLARDLGLEFHVESSATGVISKREERRFYQTLLNERAGVLLLRSEGLGLLAAPEDEALWIKADFCDAGTRYRLAQGGGNEMIAKAVSLKGQPKPTVLDCTAGLGMDAYVLAALGCEVTLLERNLIVHALLKDAIKRAQGANDPQIAAAIARMELLEPSNAAAYLESYQGKALASVLYLDPMFPLRKKSAQVKKAMQIFHTIVGDDTDAGALLPLALGAAGNRVVVKRPRHAPFLKGQPASHSLEGQRNRYDVYLKQR